MLKINCRGIHPPYGCVFVVPVLVVLLKGSYNCFLFLSFFLLHGTGKRLRFEPFLQSLVPAIPLRSWLASSFSFEFEVLLFNTRVVLYTSVTILGKTAALPVLASRVLLAKRTLVS